MISSKLKWILLIVIVLLCACGGAVLVNEAYASAASDAKKLEAIKTAFLVLGGIGVILATYLNIWQSLESGKQIADKIKFDIGENSYQLIEKFDDPALGDARSLCRSIHENKLNITPADLVAKINNDRKLQNSVLLIFNYWENVRVSINRGRVDECMLKDSLSTAFNEHYDTFKPWIDTRRQRYQDDLAGLRRRWQ